MEDFESAFMGQPPKTTQKIQTNETLQTRSSKSWKCNHKLNQTECNTNFPTSDSLIRSPPEAASNSSDQWGGYGKPWAFRATSHGSVFPRWAWQLADTSLRLLFNSSLKMCLHSFALFFFWFRIWWFELINWINSQSSSFLHCFIRICKRTASNTVGGTSGEMERLSKNCRD